MPGDKKHHTDKFRRCVEQVMAKGNDESSAYAICTTSLQDAGEPIFEAAQLHELHLLAATGTTRTEMMNGREYLVVPVVALMEGVIHAVNAKNREFVPLSTLQKAAASWNDRPVVLFHPQKEGKQCSANSPDIIASHGLGVIRNSRVEGSKLLQEAWIEKKKAKTLHPRMYEELEANKTVEVSVGAFVVTDDVPGDWNGRDFASSWIETTGDHLAFLPGARGACSVDMGCGTCRATMAHLITAEAMVPMEESELGEFRAAARKNYKECAACKGTGSLNGNPCESCEGTGELRTASISTPCSCKTDRCSCKTDSKSIPVAAAEAKPQSRAADCGCKGDKNMAEKLTRAELIAALVTDKYSGFIDGDEKMLEAASESRLEEFRSASQARQAEERARVKVDGELTNANARLKIAEERLRAAQESPSEDEWMAKAPPSIKALIDGHKAEQDAIRADIVGQLKELGENTEAELKAMSLDQLKQLAAYARVQVPDYSGRRLPQERNASANKNDVRNFEPPDPYGPALKSLQSKAVN